MRFSLSALAATFLLLSSGHAAAADLPQKIPNGEHLCKVSKEYKLRKCRVVQEGRGQVLSLYEPGHLLNLEGELHPNDFVGKGKHVFFEARLRGDTPPYVCNVKDAAAATACRDQVVMVTLTKKGNTWVGSFPLKHYWDRWVGEGDARHVQGFEITVEEISFTLKLGKTATK